MVSSLVRVEDEDMAMAKLRRSGGSRVALHCGGGRGMDMDKGVDGEEVLVGSWKFIGG